MKTPRCDAHAENTKFTDSEGWEALARDLEKSLGVWIQHAKEGDRKLAELKRENAALRARVDELVSNLAAAHEDRNKAASDYFHAKQVEIPELLRENAALREDKARLIEAAQLALDTIVCGHRHGFEPNSGAYALPRLRASIDFARKEAQP